MRDYVLELARSQQGFNAKLNAMREFLQATILRICQDTGVLRQIAFVGGTALRFLYELPRFSEDIDFSLIRRKGYSFKKLIGKIQEELRLAAYDVSVSYNDQKTVQRAMIKFEGLLHDAGLSPLRTQKLSIRVEVDTHPPAGAGFRREVVNKFFPIAFLAYDLPSEFAGKLLALFARKYTKGRDFFDVGWYLSRWKNLTPNLLFLQKGLTQAGWKKNMPSERDWRDHLLLQVRKADWKRVTEDVKNFLERPSDMEVFTQENVLRLVKPD